MKFNQFALVLTVFAMEKCFGNSLPEHSRKKRFLIEPESTQMGLFATISVPLEYEKSVSVAYFFEGNYYTLSNSSWLRPAFELPIVSGRSKSERSTDEESMWFDSLSRRFAYVVLENNIERQGLPGRACLLRAVCEQAEAPLHQNGVLGDILYIIFTPSSSKDEDLPEEFYEAEENGKAADCRKYSNTCSTSLINSFSSLMS